MNKKQFYTYLGKPESLNSESIPVLEAVLAEYPWFQTAHILYLKNLFNTGHLKFNRQLRKSAGYIADRKVLYNFLNSNIPDYKFDNEIDNSAINNGNSISTLDEVKDVRKTKKTQNRKSPVTDKKQDNISKKELAVRKKPKTRKTSTKEQITPGFNSGSKYSFDQWLKLFSDNGLSNEDNSTPISPNVDNENKFVKKFQDPTQNELIEKFIDLNPRLESKSLDSKGIEDVSLSSIVDDDSLITETLAKIYIQQKHFDRAIQAYQKLSLKYPEKNIYFAEQIEKVKKLNNK